jgi:murein DD-endopeptidase MepM/ murein hydrolase activator NlpD
MKRLLVVALLAAGVAAGAARADSWVVVPDGQSTPPSASSGFGVLLPPDLSTPPATAQQLTPQELQPIWEAAGQTYGVPWQVLAAVNQVESDFGRNMGPSSAGAVGWMQFMPDTWRQYGVDADGNGVADPWNAQDAIYAAAHYLAASGAATDLRGALLAYNHSEAYADRVLQLTASFSGGTLDLPSDLTVSVDQAQQDVDDAQAALDEGNAKVRQLEAEKSSLTVDAATGDLLGDRLNAAQDAAQTDADLDAARAEAADLRSKLDAAEQTLAAAKEAEAAGRFARAAAGLPPAPILTDGFAFPVAGGANLVSVEPSASASSSTLLAAPAGTPAYAVAEGDVVETSPDPSGDCGIAFTLQAADGRVWRYCHLAYLDAAVTPGAHLTAGAKVGLVGQTGSALTPGLELTLESGASAPADESWFAGLAGRAFGGAAVSPAPTTPPVFAVVDAQASN